MDELLHLSVFKQCNDTGFLILFLQQTLLQSHFIQLNVSEFIRNNF